MTLINMRIMTQNFTAFRHHDHILSKHIILRAAENNFECV